MAGVLDIALGYLAAGLSVITVRPDGSKAPAEKGWRAYSSRRPTEGELHTWFGNGHTYGIGIPGGPASGNLAVLDFETWPVYEKWLRSLPLASQNLTRPCPLARTPGGGAHLYTRLTDPVKGGVLAYRYHPTEKDEEGNPKEKILIEVRAEGEQVVAPGSPGCCHPSGKEYEWLRRAWLDPVTKCVPVELDEWFAWTVAAESLNEVERKKEIVRPDTRTRDRWQGEKPGDDFNRRGTWEEAGLFEFGWKWHRSEGDDRGFITRPGKKEGISGSLGMVLAKDGGHELFYCFTANGKPFQHKQSYSRWRVYAILKHRGDYVAAAKALAEKGYGDQSKGAGYSKTAPDYSSSAPVDSKTGGDDSKPAGDKPPRYRFIDHAEFRTLDFRVSWFAEWFLSKNRPAVVAGPSKGMKTSILVDLAVSVATGTPHLGKWKVPERARVAIVSGESGGFTLQETARRVCRAKGLDFDAPDGWLKWEFTLPTFADLIDTADFADRLGALGCELVIIDPFYLTLGEIDARNLFEMGRALRAVAELLLAKHKVTPVIAHHANRGLELNQPMELTHLAYSGLEQFAGQWVFINRKAAYRGDGHHELWYGHGGRDGHQGLHVVTIDEGTLGPDTPVRGWDVTIQTPEEARGEDAEEKRQEVKNREREQHGQDEAEVMRIIDAQVKRGLPGASISYLAASSATLTEYRAGKAVDRLKGKGLLVKVPEFRQPSGHGAEVLVKNGFGRPEKDRGAD